MSSFFLFFPSSFFLVFFSSSFFFTYYLNATLNIALNIRNTTHQKCVNLISEKSQNYWAKSITCNISLPFTMGTYHSRAIPQISVIHKPVSHLVYSQVNNQRNYLLNWNLPVTHISHFPQITSTNNPSPPSTHLALRKALVLTAHTTS